jgi:putative tRNA adenosine deaminase-associated protein
MGGTVSYFAAAVVRNVAGWSAAEVDLSGVIDLDEVADRLRDVDPDADLSLLFVESDDSYLVILRLDEGEDLRVFGSDSAFADESRLGALLVGDIKVPAYGFDEVGSAGGGALPAPGASTGAASELLDADDDGDEEKPAADPDADPVGDPDILADLGVSAPRLLALCTRASMLPADVTTELCRQIGCVDEVEELREA